MLDKYFNRDIVSEMTFEEFKSTYTGSAILSKLRIDIKDAFKQLGGKLEKLNKIESKKTYKSKKYKKEEGEI